MNFVGKFDAGLPFAGVHPNAKLHTDSVSGQAPSGSVVIKDAQLLFNGDYRKAGLDLVISKDGQEVVVPEYFKGDKRAALASTEGAHLTGDVVSALAATGLRIEYLHEFAECIYQHFPFMRQQSDGLWHIEGDPIPTIFSIKATKP